MVGSASASTSCFAIQRICLKRKRKCSVVFILKISLKYFSTNCLCTKTLLYSGDIFCSLITAVIDWIVPINSTFQDVYEVDKEWKRWHIFLKTSYARGNFVMHILYTYCYCPKDWRVNREDNPLPLKGILLREKKNDICPFSVTYWWLKVIKALMSTLS